MERHLRADEKQKIVDMYAQRVQEHGQHFRTVGWGSKEDQLRRFRELVRGVELQGRRILDVGCGLGDMAPFLDTLTGGDHDYIGVDISPHLIEQAVLANSGPRRQFLVSDILEDTRLEPVDVVLLSGALSIRMEENLSFVRAMVRRMFALGREVVAVNFLSTYVDYQQEKDFHCSPEEIFTFAKSLTRWVALYHDYPLWEFTLQLRQEARLR